tara:strand:+ start:471 stop:620 length:150 start_codon:yes stop_codon:yes gene_type:complete
MDLPKERDGVGKCLSKLGPQEKQKYEDAKSSKTEGFNLFKLFVTPGYGR